MDTRKLGEVILRINTRGLVKDFLETVFTPKEREEIAKRLKIFAMLSEGIPHRKIAEELGVGVETVSRGAREMRKDCKNFINWWSDLYQNG